MKNGVNTSLPAWLVSAASRRPAWRQVCRGLSRKPEVSRGQQHEPLLHVTELMLPPLSARIGLLSSGCAAIFLTLLAIQTPVCEASEYPIGGALPGDQDFPAASISVGGGYLVWEDNRIEGGKTGSGIAAAGLDSNFSATGSVFRVNLQSTGSQEKPQVLRLSNGGTLFAWEQRQAEKPGVYVRLLDGNGRFTTGDLLVNTPTWSSSVKQSNSWYVLSKNSWKLRKYKYRELILNVREQAGGVALGALTDGGAVVAYHSIRRTETNSWGVVTNYNTYTGVTKTPFKRLVLADNWMHDVFFQRLDAEGRKVGPEVMVNQYASYNQRNPAVAVLSDGRFIVVWVSEFPVNADWRHNFRVALYGRLFNAQGEPVGDEFSMAAGDGLTQANPSVAALPGGGFTVFCSQQEGTASRRWDVYAQNFGADGAASGPAFRVNDYTTGDQFGPKVATQGDNQFVVWTSIGQDGSREGVYGRLLTAGALSGDEIRVNTTTVSRQMHPTVAADGQGRFLTVWSGFVGGTGFDLFGQIFLPPPGAGVAVQGYYQTEYNRQAVGRQSPPLPPTPLTPLDAPPSPPLPPLPH